MPGSLLDYKMFKYLTRRIIGTIPVVILISLLVFMLVQLAPAIPPICFCQRRRRPKILQLRARDGIKRTYLHSILKFLLSAIQGDLGTSFRYADPVLTVIADRLPATIELAFFAILVAIIIGVPLGVWAGARPNSWVDNIGSFWFFWNKHAELLVWDHAYFDSFWLFEPSTVGGRETYGYPVIRSPVFIFSIVFSPETGLQPLMA